MSATNPGYLSLFKSGTLEKRVVAALSHLTSCDVCPLECGVDRVQDELGVCQTGRLAQVSSYGPHPGEERPLSGWRGSGTIFFARCNLRCVFCQNADISQESSGEEVSAQELAGLMLELQQMDCHNINLVSPSHIVPQILEALLIAAQQGLTLPVVYNSGGYDSLEMLKLLDGVVDIFMPDMKYSDPDRANQYSGVRDYPRVNQAAVLEIHRQVGDLQLDDDGIAQRGLLVRHLVLPNGLADSEQIFRFLAEKVSKDTYLNIMAQYRPAYKAYQFPELSRLKPKDYRDAIRLAKQYGLHRLDT